MNTVTNHKRVSVVAKLFRYRTFGLLYWSDYNVLPYYRPRNVIIRYDWAGVMYPVWFMATVEVWGWEHNFYE